MPAETGSLKGLPALLAALLVGLVLALSQRTIGPSRAELADALSSARPQRVGANEIRSLTCREAPGGFTCRWRQLEDGLWVDRAGAARIDAGGWHLDASVSGGQSR
ncbi:MAG TPA: hypothetical protein VGE65_06745 [Sphingobium sp.]